MASQLRNVAKRFCTLPKRINTVNLNSGVKRCLSSSTAFNQVSEEYLLS